MGNCPGESLNLNIYGKLKCSSGKRMKKGGVFFQSEYEALHDLVVSISKEYRK
jgi:hypothetical protein